SLLRSSLRPSWPALGPSGHRRSSVPYLGTQEQRLRLRLRRGRQLGNRCLLRRMHMKKLSVIGAALLGAAVLCAAPISLHLSQEKGPSPYRTTASTRERRWRPPQI